MSLELQALRWLAYEKKCMFAIRERTPRYMCGQPDALGVTFNGYTIEIEIKRSFSDFYADARKASRRNRDLWLDRMPKQFYYLFPHELIEQRVPTIPEWAGLMKGAGPSEYVLSVIKPAPINKNSKRLSFKECARLARQVNNHAFSELERAERFRQRFIDGFWWCDDFQI